MNFWLLLAIAVLQALDLVLKVVAPRTKTTLDDRALKLVDAAKDKLGN
jgi:hypothetical protein